MGSLKRDIDIAGRPFEAVSFSDIDCIKGLIKFRSQILPYTGFEHGTVSTVVDHYDQAGLCGDVNQEVIAIYVTLDDYLGKCEMNWKQKYIIDHIMNGHSELDMAKFFKTDTNNIKAVLDTVANRIKVINDLAWKEWFYLNIQKAPYDYKQCNGCGETLPQTRDYFSKDSRNNDGLKDSCKKCAIKRKNTTI